MEERPEDVVATEGLQPHEPRSVAAGRGIAWIGEGFSLFKQNALMWILALIVFIVLNMLAGVLGLIPIIGQIATTLLQTVLTAGIFAVCAHAEREGEVDIGQLLAGFRQNTRGLVAVGALLLVGMFIVIVPVFLMMGFSMDSLDADPDNLQNPQMLLILLVTTALIIPLIMAYWFAPALVFFHGVGAIAAFKASFRACLRNIIPFLLYGLVAGALMFIGMIPLGLGLLVVTPILMIAWYAAYKDIFLHQALNL